MDFWDPAFVPYRVRVVRGGVHATLVALAAFLAFRLLPGGSQIPPHVFATLWGTTLVAVGVAFFLPWGRLFLTNRGRLILYVWSVLDIALVTALIAWVPREGASFFFVYVLTTMFFSLIFEPRGQFALFTLTVVAYLALHAAGQTNVSSADLALRLGVLACTALLASIASRELMSGLVEAIKGRRAIEQQNALHESLVKAQSDLDEGVVIADLQSECITYANDAACRIYGYERDELVGMHYMRLLAPDQQEIARGLKRARERGDREAEYDRDFIAVRKDGTHLVVEVVSRPLEDGTVLSVVRDVTAQRREEGELREQEELFRAVSELTSDFVYSVRIEPGGEQVWEWVTDGFRSLTGYEISDPEVHNGWVALISPEHLPEATAAYRELMSTGQRKRHELEIVTRSGEERRLEVTAEPVFDPAKGRVVRIFGAAQDITERKRAEAAGRERDEVLGAISELASDFAYAVRFHPDGGMEWLWVTEGFTTVTGYTPDEITGPDAWQRLVHPDDLEALNSEYVRLFQAHAPPLVLDHRYLTKSGETKHVRTWARTSGPDSDGSVRVYGAVQDRTERTQAEEALRASEARYRTLFDRLPVGLFVRRIDGIGLDANPACVEMYRYPDRETFIDTPAQELYVDPTQRERFMEILREESNAAFEAEFRRYDGTTFWGQMYGRVARDESGAAIFFEGMVTDVTEQRRAEQAMEHSVSLLRATLESVAEGILVIDESGRIVTFNQRFADMWNIPASVLDEGERDRALGIAAAQVRDRDDFLRSIQKLTEANEEQVALIELSDGRVLERFAREAAGDGIGRVISFRDITQRRALEDQLRQAQKMEAVGRLAGGVAHDFNNLLTAILGYCELLRSSPDLTDELRSDIEEIDLAAQMGADITAQLLDLSRRKVLRPEVLDVNEVVATMEAMLGRLVGDDITLDKELVDGECRVEADRSQIEQILLNLVVNARDALAKGGRVTLSTRLVELSPAEASKGLRLGPGPHVVLTVSDTGDGIDPEVQDRIFEPFFTTRQGSSTGLGLSTVYGIVSQYNGHITVHSEIGKGSTFRVHLPAAAREAVPIARVRAAERWLSGRETVLLVEDDDAIRRLTRRTLERYGYRVLEAEGSGPALELAAEATAGIDLLLTDVVMPGLGGRELAVELGRRWPGLRVVYISGYTGEALARFGELRWNEDFVPKPFRPDVLAAKVREVLNREEPHSATR